MFKHTRAALAEYDRDEPYRASAWDLAGSNAAVAVCAQADREALRLVQMAFYDDTHAYNTMEKCLLATLDHMRRYAGGDQE